MSDALICPLIRMPCMGKKCMALIAKARWEDNTCSICTYCIALHIFIKLDKEGNVVSRKEDIK